MPSDHDYKIRLEEAQLLLQAEVEATKDDAKPVQLDQSSVGRVSRMDAMQQQQMILEGQRRRELRLMKIKSALQRIEKGSFGKCVRCTGEIAEARLNNEPEVTLCIGCAS